VRTKGTNYTELNAKLNLSTRVSYGGLFIKSASGLREIKCSWWLVVASSGDVSVTFSAVGVKTIREELFLP